MTLSISKSRTLLTVLAAGLLAVGGAVAISFRSAGSKGAVDHTTAPDPAERVRGLLTRIEKNPADADAHLQLGLLHEENGHFMAALESLQAAGDQGIRSEQAVTAIMRCLNRLQRYEEAVQFLPDSDSLKDEDVVIELTTALGQLGKVEEARDCLRKFASESDLKNRAAGSAPEMITLAKAFDALGDADSALAWSEIVIQSAPTVPDAYLISGRILLRKGNVEEASRRLVKAVSLKPESAAARELFGDALAESDRGQSGALDRWIEAIELGSRRPKTYFLAADALAKRGEAIQAAGVLTRAGTNTSEKHKAFTLAAAAWEQAGDPAQALYCRATAAAANGKASEALRHYQALSANPNREWKKRGLDGAAEMYRLLGRAGDYLAAAQRAAFTGTAADELRIANAYLLLGDSARREQHLHRAMAKDSNLAATVLTELGALAERDRKRENAIKLYEQAVEADPRFVPALLALSRLHLKDRDKDSKFQTAVEWAARASAAAPGNYEAFKQLGRACSRAGSALRAKQAYQHAIDLNPNDSESYKLLAAELRSLGEEKAAGEAELLARRFNKG